MTVLKTDAERITALETLIGVMAKQQEATNQKLDDLLALRNKGVGAFWLASALLGSGIVGTIVLFLDWLKT